MKKAVLFSLLASALPLVGCGGSGAVKRDAQLSRTHFLLGADYVKKRLPHAARQELLTAVTLDPENGDAHKLLGVLSFLEGMHSMNLLDREQCLAGLAADEQRKVANEHFREAELRLRKAVNIAEAKGKIESEALIYLANVAMHFQRYDEAIAHSKRALSNVVFGARHLALAALGWAYLQKGDVVGASRELRQAVFHAPDFCLGRYRLAKSYFEANAHDQAMEELEKVMGDKSCLIQEAHYLFGLVLTKTKDLERARSQFEVCVKQNPRSCLSRVCERLAKDAERSSTATAGGVAP